MGLEKRIVVNKFGGEIMGSPKTMRLAASRVLDQVQGNDAPVVVVSALAGMTDKLEAMVGSLSRSGRRDGVSDEELAAEVGRFCDGLAQEHSRFAAEVIGDPGQIEIRIRDIIFGLRNDLLVLSRFGDIKVVADRIMVRGEDLGSEIMAGLLQKLGRESVKLNGCDVGVITDENFSDANIIYEEARPRIQKCLQGILADDLIPVVTGFWGVTQKGQVTTLGRGGSDTTACLLGGALGAAKVILWKSVPGVLSADPAVVPEAATIDHLSYLEAEESGKVIHSKAIFYLIKEKIPAEVTSIDEPEKKTGLTAEPSRQNRAKIISQIRNLKLIKVRSPEVKQHGFLYRVAEVFAQKGINMVLIRNTRDALHFVVEKNGHDFAEIMNTLERRGYALDEMDCAMVNVVGKLDWELTSRFNKVLVALCPNSPLGAFPYRECVRLEAIVAEGDVDRMVKSFYREFIEHEKSQSGGAGSDGGRRTKIRQFIG